MKRISEQEHKQLLIDLLVNFDHLCRNNNIKYSLIGGSLIGAIRHHGIIPWDDDVDVILMPEEYKKLMKVIDNSNTDGRYKFFSHDNDRNFVFPFMKMVDTNTVLSEKGIKKIDGYGVYLDIFRYFYIPDDEKKARKIFKKTNFLRHICCVASAQRYDNLAKRFIASIIQKVDFSRWANLYIHALESSGRKTGHLINNWAIYGFEKEYQLSESFKEYIDCQFEGHKAMITKDYDTVLRTTFGDYMQIPPVHQRKKHDIEAYWKS